MIVVKDMRTRLEDETQRPLLAIKVRGEDLDDDLRVHRADGLDRFGKVLSAAILEIVTGNSGDDYMLEL